MQRLLLKSTILKLCKLSTFPFSNFSGDSEVPTDEIGPINVYCLLQSLELKPFIFIYMYLPDYKNSNSKQINIILAPNIITAATTITTTIATPTSTAKTKQQLLPVAKTAACRYGSNKNSSTATQWTQDVESMLVYRWSTVYDVGSTSNQH